MKTHRLVWVKSGVEHSLGTKWDLLYPKILKQCPLKIEIKSTFNLHFHVCHLISLNEVWKMPSSSKYTDLNPFNLNQSLFLIQALWKRSRRAKGTCSNSGLLFFLLGQVHTMNFIYQSLSLTIPTPRSGEPENFNSFFSHLKLKWSKLELKTLLSILLFINSFGLPLTFMILYGKSLASVGFLLIYTSLSKNSYCLFSLTEDVAHEMCQNNDSGKWSHRLDRAPREWAALHTSLVPTSESADPAVTRITWGGAWHSRACSICSVWQ